MQFRNETPFEGSIFATPDPDGVDTAYAVVKGTFVLGQRVDIAGKQVPVTMSEEYLGAPGQSSVRVPSDFALSKSGTDVIMTGCAYPLSGPIAYYTDVRLTVGALSKAVRVNGDRVWERTAVGLSPSSPAAFEKMPLTWERAYGGFDFSRGAIVAENRNPVGTGFFAPRYGQKQVAGSPVPNLEDRRQPIRTPDDAPVPAGFGAVCAHWEPRRSYAGTYNDAWQANRAPYLPHDFDIRFFQVAPPDLIYFGFLAGGEPVEIVGATPNAPLRFSLPLFRISITFQSENESQTLPAVLDLVAIDAEQRQLSMVWRAGYAADKRLRQIREIKATLV